MSVEATPKKSVRRRSAELGVLQSSVHRILRHDLKRLAIHGPPVACLEENHQFGYTWATIPPVAYLEENHQFGYTWATSSLSRGKSVWLCMGPSSQSRLRETLDYGH